MIETLDDSPFGERSQEFDASGEVYSMDNHRNFNFEKTSYNDTLLTAMYEEIYKTKLDTAA